MLEGIQPRCLIVVDREGAIDDLEVRIEVAGETFSEVMSDMVAFTKSVVERMHSVIGLHAKVTLVEPGTIERTAGNARHIVGKRRTL